MIHKHFFTLTSPDRPTVPVYLRDFTLYRITKTNAPASHPSVTGTLWVRGPPISAGVGLLGRVRARCIFIRRVVVKQGTAFCMRASIQTRRPKLQQGSSEGYAQESAVSPASCRRGTQPRHKALYRCRLGQTLRKGRAPTKSGVSRQL